MDKPTDQGDQHFETAMKQEWVECVCVYFPSTYPNQGSNRYSIEQKYSGVQVSRISVNSARKEVLILEKNSTMIQIVGRPWEAVPK